jgi:hypothetical protein
VPVELAGRFGERDPCDVQSRQLLDVGIPDQQLDQAPMCP